MLRLVKNIARPVYHGFYTYEDKKKQKNFKYYNNNKTTEKQIHMLTEEYIQLRKSELLEVTDCTSF